MVSTVGDWLARRPPGGVLLPCDIPPGVFRPGGGIVVFRLKDETTLRELEARIGARATPGTVVRQLRRQPAAAVNPDAYYLCHAMRSHGLPEPVCEFVFHPTRKWRFDYSWPDLMLAVEVDGGVYTQGRHIRPDGFIEDQRKRNAAQVLGWSVLCYTPGTLGEAFDDVRAFVNARGTR